MDLVQILGNYTVTFSDRSFLRSELRPVTILQNFVAAHFASISIAEGLEYIRDHKSTMETCFSATILQELGNNESNILLLLFFSFSIAVFSKFASTSTMLPENRFPYRAKM